TARPISASAMPAAPTQVILRGGVAFGQPRGRERRMTRISTDVDSRTPDDADAGGDGNGATSDLVQEGQDVLESMIKPLEPENVEGAASEEAAPPPPFIEVGESDDAERAELNDWLESLDELHQRAGARQTRSLLARIVCHAQKLGVALPFAANTPYINTIPAA